MDIHSKAAEYTKTLENTPENIKLLESEGYKKSPVSKPFNPDKVIRYNPLRGVYWFSSSVAAHMSDCYFTRQKTRTLILF